MVCRYCGKEVAEGVEMCPQCGEVIGGNGKKKYVNFIAAFGAVILVAGVLTLGIFIGRGNRNHSVSIMDNTTKATSAVDEDETETETTTEKESTTEATTKAEFDSKGVMNPDNTVDGGVYYVQTGSSLYMRKGPDTKYDPMKLMKKGTALVKKGTKNGVDEWVYVCLQDDSSIYGWVNTRYIYTRKPDTSLSTGYDECTPFKAVVNDKEGLNLRMKPDKNDGSLIGTVEYNEEVTVYGYAHYDATWFYVGVELTGDSQYSGKTSYGFMLSDYLSF